MPVIQSGHDTIRRSVGLALGRGPNPSSATPGRGGVGDDAADVTHPTSAIAPIAAGEGPLGKYVATLDTVERARTEVAVRDAYEAGRPDDPRSFANVSWACRGIAS